MARKARKQHNAADFDLDVLAGDTDMFRWFLLCYLFGKPMPALQFEQLLGVGYSSKRLHNVK